MYSFLYCTVHLPGASLASVEVGLTFFTKFHHQHTPVGIEQASPVIICKVCKKIVCVQLKYHIKSSASVLSAAFLNLIYINTNFLTLHLIQWWSLSNSSNLTFKLKLRDALQGRRVDIFLLVSNKYITCFKTSLQSLKQLSDKWLTSLQEVSISNRTMTRLWHTYNR